MIGSIRGNLIHKSPPWVRIECNGVGYEIEVPMTTFYNLPEIDAHIYLLTHMVVREDAQLLYGFLSDDERNSFRSLIKVNGIGAKVALSILSGISTQQFFDAINQQDTSLLTKIPGIGKKTAERLIVELKDKDQQGEQKLLSNQGKNMKDITDALEALGYARKDIQKAVLDLDEDIGVNEGIKQSLKWLSNKI